jgi:hypothetical protein
MYGMQTWLALPDGREEIAPAFEAVSDLPLLEDTCVSARVIMGELWGRRAATTCYAETIYAEINLGPAGTIPIDAEPTSARSCWSAARPPRRPALELYALVVLKPGEAMTLSSDAAARSCCSAARPSPPSLRLLELRQLEPRAHRAGQAGLAGRPLRAGARRRGRVHPAAREAKTVSYP